MIRRKLTRIELQLDDTKELDELLNKPIIITQQTNIFNLSSHRAFQNPSAIEKQLQSELTTTNLQEQEGNQIATTSSSNNNNNNTESQERLGYNPQPYNSSTRFQFNQSGIR